MKKSHILQPIDIVIILFVSAVAFVGFNFSVLLRAVIGNDTKTLTFASAYMADIEDKVPPAVQDVFLSPALATFLLWGFIGVICYSLVSNLQKETGGLLERLAISIRYVHPRHFKQGNFWLNNIIEIVLSVLFVIALVAWTWLTFNVFVPFGSLMVLLGLYDASNPVETLSRLVFAFGCYALALVGLQLIFTLTHALKERFA